MKIEVSGEKACEFIKVVLSKGEEILAESGLIAGGSSNIRFEAMARGGLLKSLTRMALAGEKLFVTKVISDEEGSGLYLASKFYGDCGEIEVNGDYFISSSAFIASEIGVDTEINWSGSRTFFAREGVVLLKTAGTGKLIFGGNGSVFRKKLEAGEKFLADRKYIVGFSGKVKYEFINVGGIKEAFAGTQLFLVQFEGSGEVIMQSRSSEALNGEIIKELKLHHFGGEMKYRKAKKEKKGGKKE